MEKNCGCNNEHHHHHDHGEDCECGCGEEMQYISLELDDGEEVEYGVIGIFPVDEKEYIALLGEEEDVFLYEYEEIDEEGMNLINIEDDEEFDRIAEVFYDLFVYDEE